MQKFRILALTMLVVLAISVTAEHGFAQDDSEPVAVEEVEDVVSITTAQSAYVILLGIGAGTLVAYQGYRTTNQDWDTLKFFDGLIMSVIGSVPLAIGAAITQTQFGLFDYAVIFFAAIGVGVQISKTRKKTVPSNTTT